MSMRGWKTGQVWLRPRAGDFLWLLPPEAAVLRGESRNRPPRGGRKERECWSFACQEGARLGRCLSLGSLENPA